MDRGLVDCSARIVLPIILLLILAWHQRSAPMRESGHHVARLRTAEAPALWLGLRVRWRCKGANQNNASGHEPACTCSFGHSKRDDHSATMCYMIAETGDCPFCKAIMRHTRTRHAPTLPRDEITRADPRRATHTIADPLTAPPARAHTTQCVQSRAPREHRLQLPLPHDEEARHRPQRVKRA